MNNGKLEDASVAQFTQKYFSSLDNGQTCTDTTEFSNSKRLSRHIMALKIKHLLKNCPMATCEYCKKSICQ